MKIANNVTELVGNTPLVKLNRVTAGAGATVVTVPDAAWLPADYFLTSGQSPCSIGRKA